MLNIVANKLAAWSAALALATLAAPWALAQAAPRTGPTALAQTLHAYRLEHQPAVEALPLVYPLLSEQGTVEVKPGENTLVIRDHQAAIDKVLLVLRRFDHPQRPVLIEIQVVRATAETFSPPPASQLPAALEAQLRELLPYHSYEMLAGTRLASREGEQVAYQLGERFGVYFRVGTLLEGERLRLNGFQVRRTEKAGAAVGKNESLINTNLFLHLEQTLYLGLASDEASKEALMVVVTARLDQRRQKQAGAAARRTPTGSPPPAP